MPGRDKPRNVFQPIYINTEVASEEVLDDCGEGNHQQNLRAQERRTLPQSTEEQRPSQETDEVLPGKSCVSIGDKCQWDPGHNGKYTECSPSSLPLHLTRLVITTDARRARGVKVSKILSGISEGWWMFFETFWALVLGFALSGVIQAFVSRKRMREALGTDSAASLVKATFFGIVSSSCSYAASALAKSLFSKGANFTASMVFMFASTNLVIDLGIVLWILMGWQFALAELIGGIVMIILLRIFIPILIPARLIEAARASLQVTHEEAPSSAQKMGLFNRQRWSDAAGYTVGDFTMLRTELIVGFLVAGLAAKLVPLRFWESLFISGHGFWSAVENAVLGPVLAFISFVCSLGNIPLASALWHGGISFGGVIAFIFADLLAFPLVMIYRKIYGSALAIRLALVFWLVMSLSGLITEGIFQLFTLIPTEHKMPSMGMRTSTLVLNIAALFMLAIIFWLYRTRNRGEMTPEFAKDYVCGMQVRIADAPAKAEVNGTMYYFCMDGCREAFVKDPQKFLPGVR